MTDWPRYDDVDQSRPAVRHDPPAEPRREPRAERPTGPSWTGVALSCCIGLVIVAIALSVGSASELLQARAQLAELSGEVAGLRSQLDTTKAEEAALETKLHLVDETLTQVAGKQTQLNTTVEQVRRDWQEQQEIPNLNWLQNVPPDPTIH